MPPPVCYVKSLEARFLSSSLGVTHPGLGLQVALRVPHPERISSPGELHLNEESSLPLGWELILCYSDVTPFSTKGCYAGAHN